MNSSKRWTYYAPPPNPRNIAITSLSYYYHWPSKLPDEQYFAVTFRDEDDNVLSRLEDDGSEAGSTARLALAPAEMFAPVPDPYADMV